MQADTPMNPECTYELEIDNANLHMKHILAGRGGACLQAVHAASLLHQLEIWNGVHQLTVMKQRPIWKTYGKTFGELNLHLGTYIDSYLACSFDCPNMCSTCF